MVFKPLMLTFYLSYLIHFDNQLFIKEPKKVGQWYFVTKIVLTYCEKKNSSDREKLLKFEAEGREIANIFRSLEQFIQTVKVQNNLWLQNAFLTCS